MNKRADTTITEVELQELARDHIREAEQKLGLRFDASAELDERREKVIQAARDAAAVLGGKLDPGQCTHFLSQLAQKKYISYGSPLSPIYNAMRRNMVDTVEIAGQKYITIDSFTAYLRQFQPR